MATASHATLLLCEQFFVSIRYISSVVSFAIFCYSCYYCRLSSALFRWEAASAGSGQSNARWCSGFRAALAACAAIFMAASPKLQRVRGGECSAHLADAQPRDVSHVLLGGVDPVMRRVWTLTRDGARPRRNGAKLTGAWAPRQ